MGKVVIRNPDGFTNRPYTRRNLKEAMVSVIDSLIKDDWIYLPHRTIKEELTKYGNSSVCASQISNSIRYVLSLRDDIEVMFDDTGKRLFRLRKL